MAAGRRAGKGSGFNVRVARLVRAFRRQRPLRAGSLIITIFGDAIAPRGGSIALKSLIRLCAPFGTTERLVRTSVGRLAQEHWLRATRSGRVSYYSLTGSGRNRFAEATRRIYGVPDTSWSGEWTLALLEPVSLSRRERIREELAWLGFGQLAPGTLVHAGRDVDEPRALLRELGLMDSVTLMRAQADGPAADRRIVRNAWDLRELARAYERFVRAYTPVLSALRGLNDPPPAECFVTRTLLVHHYRRIHLRDPLLPDALLPVAWSGTRARDLCRDLYSRVFAGAERHLSHNATSAKGILPPPARETLARFGGLRI